MQLFKHALPRGSIIQREFFQQKGL